MKSKQNQRPFTFLDLLLNTGVVGVSLALALHCYVASLSLRHSQNLPGGLDQAQMLVMPVEDALEVPAQAGPEWVRPTDLLAASAPRSL